MSRSSERATGPTAAILLTVAVVMGGAGSAPADATPALGRPFTAPAASAPAASAQAAGAGPLEIVQRSNERIAELLDAGGPLDAAQKAAILAVIESVTSFRRIAEISLGEHWEELTEAQRTDFVDTFARLLSVSSIDKLGRYRADRFEYTGEQVDGDQAVAGTLAFFDDRRISLDYVLERIDGEWKVTNYVIDGVDTARNYRKQFTKILATQSAEQLIARLRDKLAEYESRP